mgnify:CR=1 FL=1
MDNSNSCMLLTVSEVNFSIWDATCTFYLLWRTVQRSPAIINDWPITDSTLIWRRWGILTNCWKCDLGSTGNWHTCIVYTLSSLWFLIVWLMFIFCPCLLNTKNHLPPQFFLLVNNSCVQSIRSAMYGDWLVYISLFISLLLEARWI